MCKIDWNLSCKVSLLLVTSFEAIQMKFYIWQVQTCLCLTRNLKNKSEIFTLEQYDKKDYVWAR